MNWKLLVVRTLPFVFFAVTLFLKTIWGDVPGICQRKNRRSEKNERLESEACGVFASYLDHFRAVLPMDRRHLEGKQALKLPSFFHQKIHNQTLIRLISAFAYPVAMIISVFLFMNIPFMIVGWLILLGAYSIYEILRRFPRKQDKTVSATQS